MDIDAKQPDGFFEKASAFLTETAPDFRCSVCENDSFTVMESYSGDYRPIISGINRQTGATKGLSIWLCSCDRCGAIYPFNKQPLFRWLRAREKSA